MTLFPFEDAGTGMRGIGQVTKIMFSIPKESMGFWIERLQKHGVKHEQPSEMFGNKILTFYDFDGLQLELVMNDQDKNIDIWNKIVDKKYAIRGFFGAELSVGLKGPTQKVLEKFFDFEEVDSEGFHTRFKDKNHKIGNVIDIFEMKGWPEGIQGAGTVHHIAFRAKDDTKEIELRKKIEKDNLSPTPVIDRNYFHSVYFKEPGGILFEIATDPPGMLIDESIETLGEDLKLPSQYEPNRKYYEAMLNPIITNEENHEEEEEIEFTYRFINNDSDKTLILFHGTGANERDLIPLAMCLDDKANILSLRGNINEEGLLRFFERNIDGTFREESIFSEVDKLKSFLEKMKDKVNLDKAIFVGYSNGANFALSFILKNPGIVKNAILFHPMIPFEPEEIDLFGTNIFITSGKKDIYLRTPDEIDRLERLLSERAAEVSTFIHEGGHELVEDEILEARKFIGNY